MVMRGSEMRRRATVGERLPICGHKESAGWRITHATSLKRSKTSQKPQFISPGISFTVHSCVVYLTVPPHSAQDPRSNPSASA